jgi:preprotein translocase subunit SecA
MNLKLVQSPVENENNIEEKKISKKSYDKKISRNEPCPCGSGKKYKRCCGAL